MGKLEGKVAVVTGATSGIGQGVVWCYCEEGAKVVFCGRRAEKGQAFEKELRDAGHEATFVKADMSVDSDVDALFAAAVETYGKVDILVNNADMMTNFQVETMDIERDFDRVMTLNLHSHVYATQLAVKAMENGGSIINVASIGGLGGCPGMSSYGASKAAVLSFTRSMGAELAPKGVRVNAICPGTIFSEMMPRDGEFTQYTLAKIPMGRGGEPREIGTVAVFFASEDSSYVTGTQLIVDGGMTA